MKRCRLGLDSALHLQVLLGRRAQVVLLGVEVALGGRDRGVPEHGLHDVDRVALSEQRRVGVPQPVSGHPRPVGPLTSAAELPLPKRSGRGATSRRQQIRQQHCGLLTESHTNRRSARGVVPGVLTSGPK